MERIKILGFAYSPAKTLQNELCSMNIANPVKRYDRLKLIVNIALNVTSIFQNALLKNEILHHKPTTYMPTLQ